MTPTCWKWTFFSLAAEVLSELRAADQITRVHSLGCPSPAHASCNAAPSRSAWQRLTVSREWCFHWAAAGGRGLIGRLLVIINDVVRNNPNTLDTLAGQHWPGRRRTLHCTGLHSTRLSSGSTSIPDKSPSFPRLDKMAAPGQATPGSTLCPSLARDTAAQYKV